MSMRKVHDGTPLHAGPSLCVTCRNGHHVRGVAESQEFTVCDELPSGRDVVRWVVRECSKYDDRRLPSLHDLRQVAWVISTDRRTKQIGFLSPQERRRRGIDDPDDVPR